MSVSHLAKCRHAQIFLINYNLGGRNLKMRVLLVVKTSGPGIHMLLTKSSSQQRQAIPLSFCGRTGLAVALFP